MNNSTGSLYTYFEKQIRSELGFEPKIKTDEQGIIALYKLLDEKHANLLVQIIQQVVDFVIGQNKFSGMDYRFTTCLKLKNVYNKYHWFLLDAHIIESDKNGYPLRSVVTMTNIDLVKKDDLIYYNILKKDDLGFFATIFHGTLRDPDRNDSSGLTAREMEVIHLISEGYKNVEISKKLFISLNTVQTHRKNILKKIKCKGTAELTKYVFERVSVV
ncbi:MAG: regulatory protein LuxR [Chitinophagaceae bacterium]|nr:regulatory protein LuxR [Chitinophagaceae bacterium]